VEQRGEAKPGVGRLTGCVVVGHKRATARCAAVSKRGLGRLGDSFVHQQDGNVIPNRIDAVALSALEALPFIFEREWLLTDGADKHIE